MARDRRKATLDAALNAAFQGLERRPLPEHIQRVVDQLRELDELTPSPSPPPFPEP